LGWLLIVPAAAGLVAAPAEGKALLAGTIVAAGAALLPDLDHPESTVAHTLGPVSAGLSRGVSLLAGGHRQATHSIAFAVAAGLVTHFLAVWSDVAALLVFWAMAALAIKALHLTPPRMSSGKKAVFTAGLATLLAWLVNQYMPGDWWWLGWAVGLGAFLHLVGDGCTPGGVPLLWPWRKRMAIVVIPHTGHWLETKVLTPLMGVATLFLLYKLVLPDLASVLPWAE